MRASKYIALLSAILFLVGCATTSELEEAETTVEEGKAVLNQFCDIPIGIRSAVVPVELVQILGPDADKQICKVVDNL